MERIDRIKRAKKWLNKNVPLGWGMKYQNDDERVKSLARLLILPKPKFEDLLNIEQVHKTLSQLGRYTHYLATKPLEEWDEYDKSNYKSMLKKAGFLNS